MFENIMAVVNPGGVAKRAEARLKIAETNMKIDAVKMKHTMLNDIISDGGKDVTNSGYSHGAASRRRSWAKKYHSTSLSPKSDIEENRKILREEVGDKVDKEEGKGLSHNDFTDADRKKLDGIDEGANKTVIDSELNSYSSNPVQNQVVYEEMLKRMAQKWVGSHLYTLYGIVVPSTVNGANTGSHYLDVKTGNTYIMTRYTDRGAQAWTNTGTLQSVEEILNSKFDKSNIANNLVTTEEGYVADARQLNESIKGSFAEKIINKLSYISSRIKSSTIYEKSTKTISSTEEVAYAFNNPGIYYFNCHCIAYGTSSACLLLVSGSGSVEEAGIIILGKIEKTITFAVESSFLANGTQVVYVPRLKLNIPSGARGEYTKSLYQII